jgi:hypothetical protein
MTGQPPIPRDVNAVMEAHTARLMAIPGVTGVAVGLTHRKTPCILVLVTRSTSETKKRIPKEIEGYPVEVMVTGEIRGLPGKDA